MSKDTRQFLSGTFGNESFHHSANYLQKRRNFLVMREQGWISTGTFTLFPPRKLLSVRCVHARRTGGRGGYFRQRKQRKSTTSLANLPGYLSIRSARIFYVAMCISIPGSSSCIPRAKLSREDAKPAGGTWNLDSAPLLRIVMLVTNVTRGCRLNRFDVKNSTAGPRDSEGIPRSRSSREFANLIFIVSSLRRRFFHLRKKKYQHYDKRVLLFLPLRFLNFSSTFVSSLSNNI